MNKTLAITTIALVAVIMGLSAVSPIMVNAIGGPNFVLHCSIHQGPPCQEAPADCTVIGTGEFDNPYFIDHNNDNFHDHMSEPLFCGNPMDKRP
jgi:hypothetical protein